MNGLADAAESPDGVAPEGEPALGTDPLADDPRVVEWLGDAYPGVRRFAEHLGAEGVRRGLIGPRELPRLWERHLLNSAAVAPHLPSGTVIDVGSGAGLPGVVVALMRPDVHVVMVESMARRTAWLSEVVAELGLDAEVVRARAEELHGRRYADAVTARAVASLDVLVPWTLPLLRQGGVLVALKGDRADAELADAAGVLKRFGGGDAQVLDAVTVDAVAATRVVRVRRLAVAVPEVERSAAGRPGAGRERASRVGRGRARRGRPGSGSQRGER